MPRSWLVAFLFSIVGVSAFGATASATITFNADNTWHGLFVITSLEPDPIFEVTFFLPEMSFSAIAASNTVANWDVIAIQPDAFIPAPGFVDALALVPSAALAAGQALHLDVSGSAWSQSLPPALAVEARASDFSLVWSGTAVVTVSPVPEPSPVLLLVLGSVGLVLRQLVCSKNTIWRAGVLERKLTQSQTAPAGC